MMEPTNFGQLMVFDVFLIDSDFKIERPTRYYRHIEPQLRRHGKERNRLDRLLQRKAQQGVEVYIIL